MKDLPMKLRIFLMTVYVITFVSVFLLIEINVISMHLPSYEYILLFSFFLALAETFVVVYNDIAVSASFAIHLAVVILFKPFAALVIFIIGFSFRVLNINGEHRHILNTPVYKTLYNYCSIIIPIMFGTVINKFLGGTFDISNIRNEFHLVIIFSIVFFFLNTIITSILFSIIHNKSILYFFKSNARLGLLNSVAMVPFGIVLANIFHKYKVGGMLLVLVPIVFARYIFSLYIQSKTQYIQTVHTLMHAMEARDKYTEGHSHRVAEIAAMIARELNYSDMRIEQLNMAALLHDVGKIGIDDNILNKPGKLTEEEYEIIKSHPEIGYNILRDIKNLEEILPIVRYHHERYDGKGYPAGKKAEELNLDVFIIQLADTIDAMATDRPYRKALSEDVIIDEITKYSGSQFHPKVVDAYLNVLKRQKKAV